MKLFDLFENDDDSLRKFHKSLGDEIKANMATRQAMHDAKFKDHKWKYEIGDMIMSNKTGMVYKIVGRGSQLQTPRDENFKIIKGATKQLTPVYYYEAGDEKGTLLEPLIKDGAFTLMTKGKNVKTSPDED